MEKLLLVLTFIFLGEKIHFLSKKGDYSFDIDKSARLLTKESNGNPVDIFTIINPKDSTLYQISVTKIQKPVSSFNVDSLKSEGLALGFLDRCKCEIVARKGVEYKNFTGIGYQTISLPKKNFKGVNIMTVKGNYIYTISFLTPIKTFDRYLPAFDELLKSMEIK